MLATWPPLAVGRGAGDLPCELDEAAAVQLCRRGDPAGLGTLVQLHQRRALRVAVLITRDPLLAEDVVAEAFLTAFRRIGSFDPSRPFGPWFQRVVANGALKTLQRRARERTPDPADDPFGGLPDPGPDLDLSVLRAEDAGELRAALAQLPARQRAAIVLRYYADLNEAEIAEALGVPRGTVKSRLFNGLARLRAVLTHRADVSGWQER
ncbi:MAG TPA: RNA polymerase sigma factor [Chloroflexota bacterium]|nr:RNA polymerase sigma factor [Chloroflexota bacterium]